MPKFKVGDRVERIDNLVSPYANTGVITRIFPYSIGQFWFTEYEVKFDGGSVATFYEAQLRRLKRPDETTER